MLGLDERTVIEDVEFVEDDGDGEVVEVVVSARPRRPTKRRCGVCERRAPGYDRGSGRRRWRAMDLGTVRAVVEADAPRVCCAEHGVVVASVPWARHGSGFTRDFEEQAAWLAVRTSKSAITELMRVAWRTVGAIIARVVAERGALVDPLEGLRRIGLDEVSHRKGQNYLTVVVDHDTARLVWARAGRDKATVAAFFDELGPERAAKVRLVSSDAGSWITSVVDQRCPNAIRCMDPFHVCAWASDALDEVRRQV